MEHLILEGNCFKISATGALASAEINAGERISLLGEGFVFAFVFLSRQIIKKDIDYTLSRRWYRLVLE